MVNKVFFCMIGRRRVAAFAVARRGHCRADGARYVVLELGDGQDQLLLEGLEDRVVLVDAVLDRIFLVLPGHLHHVAPAGVVRAVHGPPTVVEQRGCLLQVVDRLEQGRPLGEVWRVMWDLGEDLGRGRSGNTILVER